MHPTSLRIGVPAALVACLATVMAACSLAMAAAPTVERPASSVRFTIDHTLGHPPYALTGVRLAVHAIVTPFVPNQRITVRVYRNGRKVVVRSLRIRPLNEGREGQFELGYASPRAGELRIRVQHRATRAQASFSGASAPLRVLDANLAVGDRGTTVRLLQGDLARLHYAISRSGTFDESTAEALTAYQKVTGLPFASQTDAHTFELLQRGAGAFRVRYPRDGKHIEADLTKQVLAEVNPLGHVRLIYDMSSGKPSTPTVVGRFHVYLKTIGVNEKGMVDSNYFIRGYAIHGYADVPDYAASHGCLRIPIPDALAVYDWLTVGDAVDVYEQSGGGSHTVQGNAGP